VRSGAGVFPELPAGSHEGDRGAERKANTILRDRKSSTYQIDTTFDTVFSPDYYFLYSYSVPIG
jgi:predicted RNase H-like nuclease